MKDSSLDDQLIEALEGSDTFVLGDPYKSEYMKILKTLITKREREARKNELIFLKDTLNEQRLKKNLAGEHIQAILIIKEYCEKRILDLNTSEGGDE